MQRFRILHCLRAPLGGLFRHVRDLAEEQSRLGHDVGILCDSKTGNALTAGELETLAEFCSLGVARHAMSRMPDPRDLPLIWKTALRARRQEIDILHGHGAKGGLYARLASRAARVSRGPRPLGFYTPHGGSIHYRLGTAASKLMLATERRLLRATDGLCFESAFAAGQFNELIASPDCAVRVIPNGVRPDEFGTHTPASGAVDFVFVGELRMAKGVDVLLHALAKLNADSTTPATALIVGDGADREKFCALAADLGLSGHVSFPGAMPAHQAFEMGRILTIPSRKESFPYIVLEAAAAQIPLIVTRVGGIPEITGRSDPFLIPPGDAEALCRAMAAARDVPEPLQARTRALQTRVRERFSTAEMARHVVEFYAAQHAATAPATSASLTP